MVLTQTDDFLNSTHWATMAHQVLDEYNSLPNAYNTNLKHSATKLLKLLNKYLLMVTSENGKNYSIRNFT